MAQAELEVLVHPEINKVGQSTTLDYDLGADTDTWIPLSSIEWYTKGNIIGSHKLLALLVRLRPKTNFLSA